MTGIFLTQEGKQEIEAKIAELEKFTKGRPREFVYKQVLQLEIYKEILSSATILPVYSNWEDVELYPPDNESQNVKTLELKNGVIIQPKQ
jgi:hypothetical protein